MCVSVFIFVCVCLHVCVYVCVCVCVCVGLYTLHHGQGPKGPHQGTECPSRPGRPQEFLLHEDGWGMNTVCLLTSVTPRHTSTHCLLGLDKSTHSESFVHVFM